MIITEFYRTRDDGTNLVRTYSDKGYMIERDGVVYEEAIDPENSNRVYTETEEEATEADYISALNEKDKIIDILSGEGE
jgi:hypothetical protein